MLICLRTLLLLLLSCYTDCVTFSEESQWIQGGTRVVRARVWGPLLLCWVTSRDDAMIPAAVESGWTRRWPELDGLTGSVRVDFVVLGSRGLPAEVTAHWIRIHLGKVWNF